MDVVKELTRITQLVSLASSPDEQLAIVVEEIGRCLSMEVCSLYLIDADSNLVLLASHGLSANRPVNIPAGRGLVGLVAKSRHTINLSNGLKHPDYYHVRDIEEEKFKSFCGAPIVSHGEIIGVLVVQGRKARRLSDQREAFLTTLASHIALIAKTLPENFSTKEMARSFVGISASEGLAIGAPVICERSKLSNVPLAYGENVDRELDEWRRLLERVVKDLESERAMLGQSVSAEISDLFNAYKMLLLDKAVSDHVEQSIRDGFSLPFSLKISIQHFADIFKQIDDPYFQARSEDIWHIGNKLYQSYLGEEPLKGAESAGSGNIILIGHEISVSDMASFPPERLKGIVCEGGARLSHTSILANALGIPAVMGVEGILRYRDVAQIIIDGTEGKVFVNPSKAIVREYTNAIDRRGEEEKALLSLRDMSAVTKSGRQIQLLANSGLVSDISPGIRNGAEGIGLFRTEIAFMTRESFPTETDQYELYNSVFAKYKDKPVYMRTLDIGSDKQLPYFPISGEDNPAMGWRGVRFTLDNVQLLMTQLRAMLRAAGKHGELNIIIPMVSTHDEIIKFKGVLADAISQLKDEGCEIKQPKVGVMVEVPAAISQLRFWAEDIDFVSIGTNDLSQYLLALDRNNPKVAPGFDLVHPAVLSEVNRAVSIANKLCLPVCVCGEMASDPVSVLLLIAMGVKKLSVSAAKILKLKALIRALDESSLETFLAYALEQRSAKAIREEGERMLRDLI